MNIKRWNIMCIVFTIISTLLLPISVVQQSHANESNLSEQIPKEMYGLDYYISISNNKLCFDSNSALSNGYSNSAVEFVSNQINYMNTAIKTGSILNTEDYSVTSTSLTTYVLSKAKGINKEVHHWYGLHEFWMDSEKTKQYISGLEKGNVGKYIPGWLGTVAKLYSSATIADAKMAARPGRGIIMYSQFSGTGITSVASIWHHSQ